MIGYNAIGDKTNQVYGNNGRGIDGIVEGSSPPLNSTRGIRPPLGYASRAIAALLTLVLSYNYSPRITSADTVVVPKASQSQYSGNPDFSVPGTIPEQSQNPEPPQKPFYRLIVRLSERDGTQPDPTQTNYDMLPDPSPKMPFTHSVELGRQPIQRGPQNFFRALFQPITTLFVDRERYGHASHLVHQMNCNEGLESALRTAGITTQDYQLSADIYNSVCNPQLLDQNPQVVISDALGQLTQKERTSLPKALKQELEGRVGNPLNIDEVLVKETEHPLVGRIAAGIGDATLHYFTWIGRILKTWPYSPKKAAPALAPARSAPAPIPGPPGGP